jgi:hypothetical protein
MRYHFTPFFVLLFGGMIIITLAGGFEKTRGLDFLLGVTLFGMLEELHGNSTKKKVKDNDR